MKTKAAVLYEHNAPFVIEELELQEPKDGEVLIELTATGICRTDEHAWDGSMINPLPAVLGHEGAGIVRQVGKGVTDIKEGDHVISAPSPSCGKCEPCRTGSGELCVRGANLLAGHQLDGTTRLKNKKGQDIHSYLFLNAFSEYMVIPADSTVVIDKQAPLDKVCLLGCAATTGFGAATRTVKVEAGSTAALYGFGGVGSGVLNGLVQSGADMIIVVEPREWKEEIARKMGATHFINPEKVDPVEKIRLLTYGIGVDYAFDCWGSVQVEGQCFRSIRNKGTAVFVGAPNMAHNEIPMNSFEFIVTEKIVRGSLQGSTVPKVDIPKFVSLYQHGKLDLNSVITKEFKLEEINKAFKAMQDGEVIRGIIKFR